MCVAVDAGGWWGGTIVLSSVATVAACVSVVQSPSMAVLVACLPRTQSSAMLQCVHLTPRSVVHAALFPLRCTLSFPPPGHPQLRRRPSHWRGVPRVPPPGHPHVGGHLPPRAPAGGVGLRAPPAGGPVAARGGGPQRWVLGGGAGGDRHRARRGRGGRRRGAGGAAAARRGGAPVPGRGRDAARAGRAGGGGGGGSPSRSPRSWGGPWSCRGWRRRCTDGGGGLGGHGAPRLQSAVGGTALGGSRRHERALGRACRCASTDPRWMFDCSFPRG